MALIITLKKSVLVIQVDLFCPKPYRFLLEICLHSAIETVGAIW